MYWEWRTYKHQQGSLVWNRTPISYYYKMYWYFSFTRYQTIYKDRLSFKVS